VGRGLPHVTIEVRQDLVDTHHGAETWANLLAAALGELFADSTLFRKIDGRHEDP
jgi:predicted N-formylglutamate amidohydrolase